MEDEKYHLKWFDGEVAPKVVDVVKDNEQNDSSEEGWCLFKPCFPLNIKVEYSIIVHVNYIVFSLTSIVHAQWRNIPLTSLLLFIYLFKVGNKFSIVH